MTNAFGYLL